jgi:hypothetical protein
VLHLQNLKAGGLGFGMELRQSQLAQDGESCGGFVANAKRCAPGLICKGAPIPDVPGTCVKE